MTTRNQVIDALYHRSTDLGPERAGRVYDVLFAAGLLVPDEEPPPKPKLGLAHIVIRDDGRGPYELYNDAGEKVDKPWTPADVAAANGRLISSGTISGDEIDWGTTTSSHLVGPIPTPGLTITEPMPPSLIEAIEGTAWLAEHDTAIREGIAAAIEADILSDPSTANERRRARRDAFIARDARNLERR